MVDIVRLMLDFSHLAMRAAGLRQWCPNLRNESGLADTYKAKKRPRGRRTIILTHTNSTQESIDGYYLHAALVGRWPWRPQGA